MRAHIRNFLVDKQLPCSIKKNSTVPLLRTHFNNPYGLIQTKYTLPPLTAIVQQIRTFSITSPLKAVPKKKASLSVRRKRWAAQRMKKSNSRQNYVVCLRCGNPRRPQTICTHCLRQLKRRVKQQKSTTVTPTVTPTTV